MRRAAFLDRDGVLCESVERAGKPSAPLTLDEFRLVEGIGPDVARLRSAGLLAIVFTNQPEVARGLLKPEILDEMHRRLRAAAVFDDVYVCPHERSQGCACCKPRPGMLVEAAKKWEVDLRSSFVVGDRWVDIEAGRAVGARTLLIERPYSQCTTADERVPDLKSAVDRILEGLT